VEISGLDEAVSALRLDSDRPSVDQRPRQDARFGALCQLIDKRLRNADGWRDDERLVVFTEYKTTLDYVTARLREKYEDDRSFTMFGGWMTPVASQVKEAFNDPRASVRILVATDAAAEGLNLQRTARYLLHFDCPWNPSRLEQRNGRLDRHGQARDVSVHYFVSDRDQDIAFQAHVVRKAHEIREDLGSANELFDEAAHRRLVAGESAAAVQADLDHRVRTARGRAAIDADATTDTGAEGRAAEDRLLALAAEIDLDPGALRDTLEAAMAIRAGRPQLDCSEAEPTCRIVNPGLPGWSEVIDESLRRAAGRGVRGPVARVAFSPEPFLEDIAGRIVFRPRPDVLLLHLSHPMLQRALSALTRRRFPGTGEKVSRWTVRIGGVPAGAQALVLLTVEELAVNELRETFHHWVRTVAFPVRNGALRLPLSHRPAMDLRGGLVTHDRTHQERARSVLSEVEPELKRFLVEHGERLTRELRNELEAAGVEARRTEEERYRSRQGEVSSLIAETTLAKLEREIVKLEGELAQGLLFDESARLGAFARSLEEKKAEVARRTRHYEEVRRPARGRAQRSPRPCSRDATRCHRLCRCSRRRRSCVFRRGCMSVTEACRHPGVGPCRTCVGCCSTRSACAGSFWSTCRLRCPPSSGSCELRRKVTSLLNGGLESRGSPRDFVMDSVLRVACGPRRSWERGSQVGQDLGQSRMLTGEFGEATTSLAR
jgi:hypothetical protein